MMSIRIILIKVKIFTLIFVIKQNALAHLINVKPILFFQIRVDSALLYFNFFPCRCYN